MKSICMRAPVRLLQTVPEGLQDFDETKHRRIQNVKINGKPIQKNTMYTIAGTEEFLTKSAAGSAFCRNGSFHRKGYDGF